MTEPTDLAAAAVAVADAAEEARRASRPAPPPPEVLLAADVTGLKPREIAAVSPHRHGWVVRTRVAGPEMLFVDPARPDASGRSGLMVLDPSGRYRGPLPVFDDGRRPAPVVVDEAEAEREERRRSGLRGAWRRRRLAVARAEVEAAEADPTTAVLEEQAARLDAVVAAGGAGAAVAAEQAKVLRLLVRGRRAEALGRHLAAHPVPPDPVEVERMRAVAGWARDVLAARSDWAVREATIRWAAVWPAIAAFNPGFAERELWAAERWLAGHGVDEVGGGPDAA